MALKVDLNETVKLILVMAKAEGNGENWHGLVTALSVTPYYRRCGLARKLMKHVEDVSEA